MYALDWCDSILQGVVVHRQALEPNSELVNLKVITPEFPVRSSRVPKYKSSSIFIQGNGHVLLPPGV